MGLGFRVKDLGPVQKTLIVWEGLLVQSLGFQRVLAEVRPLYIH